MKKQITIPIFIPHAGCPHCCIFCNQKSISGQKYIPTEKETRTVIERHLSTSGGNTKIEIGFFGGTFTALPQTIQTRFLDIAQFYINKGLVSSVRFSTRPDSINKDKLTFLKKYTVKTIELGVQSFDPVVLQKALRGHSTEDVFTASKLVKEFEFDLGIQLMPGLPGSSFESDIKSMYEAASLQPDCIRIYPTLVVQNTGLENLYNSGSFTPLSLEEAVRVCAKISTICTSEKIPIIRMGIHPLELSENSTLIAGPYHTAFGFLVKARLKRDNIEALLSASSDKISGSSEITLEFPEKCYEEYIGMKKENIHYLEKKFSITIQYIKGSELSILSYRK